MSNPSDFVIENEVLKKYVGPGGDVVIPWGVTQIGDSAFSGCKSLESITIPDSVTQIGRSAFSYCRNMKSIMIPDSVSKIGEGAFHACPGLADAEGYVIFRGSLFDYVGPSGEVIIPDNVTSISTSAFENCRDLKSVGLPNGLLSIGDYAFSQCNNLTNVTIPEGVIHIGNSAFYGCCNLTSIAIPDSIRSIGLEAFKDCEKVHFVASAAAKALIEQYDFIIENSVLKKYNGPGGDVVIPDGVLTIDHGAFGYSKLTSVTIPKSVTMIQGSGARTMGAFWSCWNLEKVTIFGDHIIVAKDSFYDCGNLTEVFAPSLPYATLIEAGLGMQAAKAFMNQHTRYTDDTIRTAYINYICSQRKRLLPMILERDDTAILKMMAEAKKITPKNIEQDFLMPAMQTKADKCVEYLKSLGDDWGLTVALVAREKKPEETASDFVIKKGVLKEYHGLGGDIVLPEGIQKIDSNAFTGCDKLTSVVIPEGVTVIGAEAFANCSELRHVVLPDSLKEIWWGAFRSCKSLMGICMPKGVTKIDWRTFENCSSLVDVIIQDRKTRFDDSAFDGCAGLADSNGLVIVNGILFDYLGSGGELTIPGNVTRVAENAFCKASELTSVTILEGVTEIGENAFKDCGSLLVVLPGSLKKAKSAFSGCTCRVHTTRWSAVIDRMMADCVLEEVIAEDYSAFSPERLMSLLLQLSTKEDWNPKAKKEGAMLDTLKKNVGELCGTALEDMEKLRFLCTNNLIPADAFDSFLIEADKAGDAEKKALLLDYQNRIGVEEVEAVRANKEKLMKDYAGTLAERVALRNPADGIKGMTFVITGKLSGIWRSRKEVQEYLKTYGAILDDAVTKQTDYLVTNDADSESEKSQKADNFGVPVISEADFNEIVGRRFNDAPHITIPIWLKEIPKEAFKDCSSLMSVTIPDGVTSIGEEAFYNCTALTNLVIPDSVTSIGDAAFKNCSSLKNVSIPDSLNNIGKEAFRNCKGLANNDGLVIVGNALFNYYGTGKDVVIPDGVKRIEGFAFNRCKTLTTITIPDSVTSIGWASFSDCSNLANITIPDSVTSIGGLAFCDCNSLTRVTLSNNVQKIGADAFMRTPLLSDARVWESGVLYIGKALIRAKADRQGSYSITIKEGTCCIADNAFSDCEGLKEVNIPESVTAVGDSAFLGCKNLKKLILPDKLTQISRATFYGCKSLTDIIIPESVTKIDTIAFFSCRKLASVTIPKNVKEIDKEAFDGCPNLTIHSPAGSFAEKYAKKKKIPFLAE